MTPSPQHSKSTQDRRLQLNAMTRVFNLAVFMPACSGMRTSYPRLLGTQHFRCGDNGRWTFHTSLDRLTMHLSRAHAHRRTAKSCFCVVAWLYGVLSSARLSCQHTVGNSIKAITGTTHCAAASCACTHARFTQAIFLRARAGFRRWVRAATCTNKLIAAAPQHEEAVEHWSELLSLYLVAGENAPTALVVGGNEGSARALLHEDILDQRWGSSQVTTGGSLVHACDTVRRGSLQTSARV